MVSIERKMPNLTDRERKVLNKHTKSIINQLLKDPILQAKEFAGNLTHQKNWICSSISSTSKSRCSNRNSQRVGRKE